MSEDWRESERQPVRFARETELDRRISNLESSEKELADSVNRLVVQIEKLATITESMQKAIETITEREKQMQNLQIDVSMKVKGKLLIKHGLIGISVMIALVCALFLAIQMHWIQNSVIGDDHTTAQLPWTSFHYYNGLTYIVMSAGVRLYTRWRISGQDDVRMKKRKDDWL